MQLQVLTIKLGSHQVDREDLVGSCQTTTVNLAILNRIRLEKLFKHDAVVGVFSSRDANAVRTQRLNTHTHTHTHTHVQRTTLRCLCSYCDMLRRLISCRIILRLSVGSGPGALTYDIGDQSVEDGGDMVPPIFCRRGLSLPNNFCLRTFDTSTIVGLIIQANA